MGFDKLAADLAGQSVLARSVAALEAVDAVAEIIVVTSADRAATLSSPKISQIVPGGAERHLSVWAGIEACADDAELIAVHDGARPLVAPSAIEACAAVAAEHGAASLAHRVVDTLKRTAPGSQIAAESVSRDDLWAMQTPQIFRREVLIEAYQKVLSSDELVTDEVSAIQSNGGEVHLVENTTPNLKITVPEDLAMAERVLGGDLL